jgi:uncharacterized membrane protein
MWHAIFVRVSQLLIVVRSFLSNSYNSIDGILRHLNSVGAILLPGTNSATATVVLVLAASTCIHFSCQAQASTFAEPEHSGSSPTTDRPA